VIADERKQPESKVIEVRQLVFDKNNPRFPKDIAEGPVSSLIDRFIRDERLLEIIESIGDQGYFPGEPLLVVPKENKYVVVEGNRRLAALKLLSGELEPPIARISIANAVEAATNRPGAVPCLVFQKEDQILRYLGFRHITGIKSWSALQKARYVKRLHVQHYQHLPHKEGLKLLARETGSHASYIGQMLSALALYEKAEKNNFYELDVEPNNIDFSVLSTALSYSNVVDYVGLEDRTDVALNTVKPENLRNLFLWLFVTKGNQKSIVGESRHLKKLAAVVTSPAAVKELLKSGMLDEAFEFSKGPSIALTEALIHAERRLNAAWQWLPKVSELTNDHRERSEAIARIANAIRSTLASQVLDESVSEPRAPKSPVRRR
jgi:hypothetical protein